MAHYSLNQLTALLARWDKLAEACNDSQNCKDSLPEDQIAYYAGMAFGMELARDELAAIIALTMVDVTELSPSLM